jgi:GNAT superfamily N-acetyltransferase
VCEATRPTTAFSVRHLDQTDLFWLKDYDCTPLHLERDSVYLFFCVHFRGTSFVAWSEAEARPLGFLLGFVGGGGTTAYVHYMFVELASRGRGIGSTLLRAFEARCSELGAKRVVLFTARARAFYEGNGYAVHGGTFEPRIAEYLRDVKHATVMSRALP